MPFSPSTLKSDMRVIHWRAARICVDDMPRIAGLADDMSGAYSMQTNWRVSAR